MNFPTAEEVCEVIELMALSAGEDDSTWTLLYRLTHCREREGRCKNPHEGWVKEFREAQSYLRNQNKAPRDPTKEHGVVNPFTEDCNAQTHASPPETEAAAETHQAEAANP